MSVSQKWKKDVEKRRECTPEPLSMFTVSDPPSYHQPKTPEGERHWIFLPLLIENKTK